MALASVPAENVINERRPLVKCVSISQVHRGRALLESKSKDVIRPGPHTSYQKANEKNFVVHNKDKML